MNVFDWQVGNQDSLPTVHEKDTATLCKRGSHQLILDEEIGLRCKFCTYLAKDIKYIFPEFVSLRMFLSVRVKTFFYVSIFHLH